MSALKKPIDENATGEFVLPESFRKKAEELKEQNKNLVTAITQAKEEQVVRKEDESTKVFNLRQFQLNQKIKELEERKLKTEKELALITQKKNSTLHSDLKKATEMLVSETKRIVPLEKEIEAGVTKITNIKNEIQLLFENSIEERKRNGEAINEQSKEIQELNVKLKETLNVIKNEQTALQATLITLNEEVLKLNQAKSDLTITNLKLKEENHSLESLKQEIIQKKEECFKLDQEISVRKDKIIEYQENVAKFSSLEREIEEIKQKKQDFEIEIKNLNLNKEELFQQSVRADYSLKDLEEQLSSKKNILSRINEEILEAKKDLEKIRTEQFELQKVFGREQEKLNQIQGEISKLDAHKASALKLQDEAYSFYQEKKKIYQREISLMEENFQKKYSSLESEFEAKKLQIELDFKNYTDRMEHQKEEYKQQFETNKVKWDDEFKDYCDKKQLEFNHSIELINTQDLERIKANKKEFIAEISHSLKLQLTRPGFFSTEEKIEDAKKEMSKTFDKYFGKTSRWKFW